MYACCNYLEIEDKPCEGEMELDDKPHPREFVCKSCKGRCGIQVHPEHAEYRFPTYEVYNFSEVAEALQAVRKQHHVGKPPTWTGPDEIHYSITAGVPEPSWHFSPDGLEHSREQGRNFWDNFIQVAFMFGWHNGVVKREQSDKIARTSLEWRVDDALEALENGELTRVKSLLESLKRVR